jgi:hypothetical protein
MERKYNTNYASALDANQGFDMQVSNYTLFLTFNVCRTNIIMRGMKDMTMDTRRRLTTITRATTTTIQSKRKNRLRPLRIITL